MERRLMLHKTLVNVLGSDNVYFQPPESVKIKYPCILYERDYIDTAFADNQPYMKTKRYSVVYITKNPDSCVVDKLSDLPMCSYERGYKSDNLNHDVFTIYF